jgi:RNA polymerase sigma-70 factor (ECF subfamily)
MDTLEILIERAKNRDNEAFREIFESLEPRVFSYACSHVERREDAKDITQEAFIDLWRGLKNFSYRTPEEFYGFVFLITKRKIARFYKEKKNDISLEETEMDVGFSEEHEDHRFLLRHIESLAEKYQEILRLRYWGGMKLSEAALVLGIDEGTAKVRHYRALQQLRSKIEPYT